MEHFASNLAKLDTLELALSAGRTALKIRSSVTMVLIATNPMLMEEVLAKYTAVTVVRNGALSGTPSATRASILLAVASAPQTALLA